MLQIVEEAKARSRVAKPAEVLIVPTQGWALHSQRYIGVYSMLGSHGNSENSSMARFYEPDLSEARDNPFARDASGKLVRRSYWTDMSDRTFVMAMTKGLGVNLTNEQKRAHLADLRREHLIDQVCAQEILPPERR